MTDKELLKQAYDALDKITDMFDAVNGRCVMGGDDIYDFAIQAMMQLDERLKQEQLKTNQCAETCERAKLCAVCGVSLNQEQGAVAWMYTNAQGKTVIVESDVPPYDDAVPLFKSEPQPEQSAMCANDIEHFHAYAKEFILPITLKSLIESHKKLCRISQIKNDEWLKELAAATELGRKQGLEFVTDHEFVSIEKLKSMTINELVLFLYDGE